MIDDNKVVQIVRIILFGLVLVAIAVAAALSKGAEPTVQDEVSLLVIYDQGPASKAMFPKLARMRESGYRVVYINGTAKEAKDFLDQFYGGVHTTFPLLITYRGHEAWEEAHGNITIDSLCEWYNRTARGEMSKKGSGVQNEQFKEHTGQLQYLQDTRANAQVYLRSRLGPPSCGMAWCMVHRSQVLEYVDAQGNVVGRVQ